MRLDLPLLGVSNYLAVEHFKELWFIRDYRLLVFPKIGDMLTC